ncbi:hypothetical protein GGQ99_002078 [Aminobacter niigataensis]|uniref:Uncharacterized protein n=1 Tax=Aminobacter niigataensis TaxID=83265 RepID=A0ABR6L118_9HYPH|nr:hypothetical protein [Aminobacter niigataensis]
MIGTVANSKKQKPALLSQSRFTDRKRPFSDLFNVAASRPAKSPRVYALLLRLGADCVNRDPMVQPGRPFPSVFLDIGGPGGYFRCGLHPEAPIQDFRHDQGT